MCMAVGLGVCVPPDLCAFARWDGGLRAVFVEHLVAFPLIVAAIGADLLDLSRRVLKSTKGDPQSRSAGASTFASPGRSLRTSRSRSLVYQRPRQLRTHIRQAAPASHRA